MRRGLLTRPSHCHQRSDRDHQEAGQEGDRDYPKQGELAQPGMHSQRYYRAREAGVPHSAVEQGERPLPCCNPQAAWCWRTSPREKGARGSVEARALLRQEEMSDCEPLDDGTNPPYAGVETEVVQEGEGSLQVQSGGEAFKRVEARKEKEAKLRVEVSATPDPLEASVALGNPERVASPKRKETKVEQAEKTAQVKVKGIEEREGAPVEELSRGHVDVDAPEVVQQPSPVAPPDITLPQDRQRQDLIALFKTSSSCRPLLCESAQSLAAWRRPGVQNALSV